MTADVSFVNFPSFSFENVDLTPSRTFFDNLFSVWNQTTLAQRATCALDAPPPSAAAAREARLGTQDPGPLAASPRTAPLLSVSYLGLSEYFI